MMQMTFEKHKKHILGMKRNPRKSGKSETMECERERRNYRSVLGDRSNEQKCRFEEYLLFNDFGLSFNSTVLSK